MPLTGKGTAPQGALHKGSSSTGGRLLVVLLAVSAVLFTLSVREAGTGVLSTTRNTFQMITTPVRQLGMVVTSPVRAVGNIMSNLTADQETLSELQAEIDELRILAMRNQKEALVQRFSAGRQLSEGDTRLLMDAYSVVRQHIQDENFSVEQLSEALFMSRSSLHRKLKACTGGSALDFIRKVRFDQACVLLREGGLTIAEIAYKVGFSSPAYFSDAFKRFTGISPSTFSGLQQN